MKKIHCKESEQHWSTLKKKGVCQPDKRNKLHFTSWVQIQKIIAREFRTKRISWEFWIYPSSTRWIMVGGSLSLTHLFSTRILSCSTYASHQMFFLEWAMIYNVLMYKGLNYFGMSESFRNNLGAMKHWPIGQAGLGFECCLFHAHMPCWLMYPKVYLFGTENHPFPCKGLHWSSLGTRHPRTPSITLSRTPAGPYYMVPFALK